MGHKVIHAVFHAQNVGYVAQKALCAQTKRNTKMYLCKTVFDPALGRSLLNCLKPS